MKSFVKKIVIALMAVTLIGTSVDTTAVTVKAATTTKVTSVSLNQTAYALAYKKSVILKATVAPSSASNKSVTWKSSNTKVATVSSTGKVTATSKAGTATITATAKDGSKKSASAKITVAKTVTKVTKVTMSKSKVSVNVGKTTTLKATAAPSKATVKSLVWTSSDPSVATVDQSGKVTAIKKGTATITATAQDGSEKKATAKVSILQPVASMSMSQTAYALSYGKSVTLKATVAPANASNKSVTWKSSNTKVATVSSTGKVTAKKTEGKATITATAKDGSGKKVSITVKVEKSLTKTKSIKISAAKVSLNVGKTTTLKASVSPSNTTLKTLVWTSSDSSKATVDKNGKVTAVKAGTVTIKATAQDGSGKSVSSRVTVISPKVSLSATKLALSVGGTSTLKATVKDALGTTVTWKSSAPAVATVDANGKVTAVKAGTAAITATSKSGKTATCSVTVSEVAVTGVTLSESALSFTVGDAAKTLKATVAPANATNKTVTWSSSDTTVATVKDGVVTPLASGTTTITATAGGKMATCEVAVIEKSVTDIKIKQGTTDVTGKTVSIAKGGQAAFTAELTPSDAKHTVSWSSDSNIITVNKNGVVDVNGAAAGTEAVITATADNKSAQVTVRVTGEENAVSTSEEAVTYVISKNASSVKVVKGVSTTSLSADQLDELVTIYNDLLLKAVNATGTTAQNLESAWTDLTQQNIDKELTGVGTEIKVADVAAPAGYRAKTITVTLTDAGVSRTITLVAPESFEDSQQITVINGTATALANNSGVIINIAQLSTDAQSATVTAEFTATVVEADGTNTTRTFEAVVGSSSATLSLVESEGSRPVVTYTETATAYELTIEKAFYDNVVNTFDTAQEFADLEVYNVFN